MRSYFDKIYSVSLKNASLLFVVECVDLSSLHEFSFASVHEFQSF